MKVSEVVLPAHAKLMLWLPKDGFSEEFLRSIERICSGFPDIDEAYLALMGEGGSLLIALQITEPSMKAKPVNEVVAEVMEALMSLLEETVQVDAICLNGQPGVRNSISSLTSPFYKRK